MGINAQPTMRLWTGTPLCLSQPSQPSRKNRTLHNRKLSTSDGFKNRSTSAAASAQSILSIFACMATFTQAISRDKLSCPAQGPNCASAFCKCVKFGDTPCLIYQLKSYQLKSYQSRPFKKPLHNKAWIFKAKLLLKSWWHTSWSVGKSKYVYSYPDAAGGFTSISSLTKPEQGLTKPEDRHQIEPFPFSPRAKISHYRR